MVSAGKNIVGNMDQLQKITVKYLHDSIKNPKPEIIAKIRQLRIVKELDQKQYNVLKKQLPYFVCGLFNPPYRRIANFAFTNYFVIDIDHVSEKNQDIDQLRTRLIKDDSVMMCFKSPGEDGLKLMFKLKDRCFDAGLYSLFYKVFAKTFSVKHSLQQVLDVKTSDVSRACFISYDPQIYYNVESVPIEIETYLSLDNPQSLFDIKREVEKKAAFDHKENAEAVKVRDPDPDAEGMLRIKELLNPVQAKRDKEKIPVYVPEILNDIISDLKTYIEETGVVVSEILNIQYGKKIRLKMTQREAEINLFYGKRGFSVVQSPRTGTNMELNQLMCELIENFIFLKTQT